MGRHWNSLTLTLRLWCVNTRVNLTGSFVELGTQAYPVPRTDLMTGGRPKGIPDRIPSSLLGRQSSAVTPDN